MIGHSPSLTRGVRSVLAPVLLVLAVLAAPLSAWGQPEGTRAQITASLSPSRVAVGDSALLKITVEGADADSTPVPPTVPGLQIQYLDAPRSSGTYTQIINGRRTSRTWSSVEYRYRVTPQRNGRFDLPPIPVSVGGQVVNTPSLTILAAEPEANPDYIVELELMPKEAYVGQPVILRTTWYVSSRVSDVSFNLPGLERLRVSPAPDPRPPGTQTGDASYPPIPFIGGQLYGVAANVERNGQGFTAVTMDIVLSAAAAGSYQLGPMRVAFNAATERGGPNLGLFPGRGQRIVIASNAVTLDVKPLPTQGKPAGFDTTGLVGEYTLAASAAPTTVRAGDPIDLLWRVSNPVAASLVPPMVLTSQRELAERFRVPVEPVVPRVFGHDAVFQASIRARPGTTRIPPLALNVFDTKTGQYRVLKSEPIELNVLPGGMISADEPVGPATDTHEAPALAPIEPVAAAVDPDSLLADRAVLGLVVAPPAAAALMIAGVLGRRRWLTDPVAQTRRAGRRALRSLRRIEPARPDAPDRAAAALRAFESRVAQTLGPGHESLAVIERHIDRLDRRRFAGRAITIDRKDLDEIAASVRGVAGSVHAKAPAPAGITGAMVLAVTLCLTLHARAADTQKALDGVRAAESMALADPTQAKGIAATAIDELLPLANGPEGRTASLHLALARGYGVSGDVGRRELALRRAQRLAPWNTVDGNAPGSDVAASNTTIPTTPMTGATAEPVPLGWMGYVRIIPAPVRLWLLAGAWVALWGLIVVGVAVGGVGGVGGTGRSPARGAGSSSPIGCSWRPALW